MAVVRIDLEVGTDGAAKISQVTGQIKDLGEAAKVTHSILEGIGLGVGEKLFESFKDLPAVLAEVGHTIAEMIEHVANYAHAIEVVGAKTGLSTDAIQKLGVAARLTGTDIGAVTTAAGKMEKAIGTDSKAFGDMGLNLEKLKSESPDKAFQDVITRLGEMTNQNERAAAGAAVFGRGWQELSGIIADPKALTAATRLGAVVGTENVEAAARLKRQSEELSVAWEAVQNQFAASIASSPELMSAFAGITDDVSELAKGIAAHTPEIQALFTVFIRDAKAAAEESRILLSIWAGGGKGGGAPGGALLTSIASFAVDHLVGGGAAELLVAYTAQVKKEAEAERTFEDAIRGMGTGMGTGGRAGYDPAAAAAAEAAARAYEKAAEASRKAWDKFYQEEETKGHEALLHLGNDNEAYAKRVGKVWEDAAVKQVNDYAKAQEAIHRLGDHNAKVFEEMYKKAGQQVASAFDLAASHAGSTWGAMFHEMGQLSQQWVEQNKANLGDWVAEHQKAIAAVIGFVQALFSAYQGGVASKSPTGGAITGALGGAAAGAVAGSVIPGIGTAAGAIIGGVAGGISGYVGGKNGQAAELKDLVGQFDAIMLAARQAGVVFQHVFDPKTPAQYAAAIDEIKKAMDMQAQAEKAVDDAMQRYGITIDQMGPRFKQQKLDEQAAGLIQDYKLLTNAGADHLLVLDKMGPAIDDYVNTAVKAGVDIPQAMKPIIDDLYTHGKLLHEDGTAYTEAEYQGLHYGKTQSEMFDGLMKKITDLVNALLGIGAHDYTIHVPVVPDDPGGLLSGNPNHPGPTPPSGPAGPPGWGGPGFNFPSAGGGVDHDNKPWTPAALGFHGMAWGPRLFLAGEAGPERVDIGGGGSEELLDEMRGLRNDMRSTLKAIPKQFAAGLVIARG
jgi:hypothetical protein